ncbi:hypothetical protein [Halosimplex sp. J119]
MQGNGEDVDRREILQALAAGMGALSPLTGHATASGAGGQVGTEVSNAGVQRDGVPTGFGMAERGPTQPDFDFDVLDYVDEDVPEDPEEQLNSVVTRVASNLGAEVVRNLQNWLMGSLDQLDSVVSAVKDWITDSVPTVVEDIEFLLDEGNALLEELRNVDPSKDETPTPTPTSTPSGSFFGAGAAASPASTETSLPGLGVVDEITSEVSEWGEDAWEAARSQIEEVPAHISDTYGSVKDFVEERLQDGVSGLLKTLAEEIKDRLLEPLFTVTDGTKTVLDASDETFSPSFPALDMALPFEFETPFEEGDPSWPVIDTMDADVSESDRRDVSTLTGVDRLADRDFDTVTTAGRAQARDGTAATSGRGRRADTGSSRPGTASLNSTPGPTMRPGAARNTADRTITDYFNQNVLPISIDFDRCAHKPGSPVMFGVTVDMAMGPYLEIPFALQVGLVPWDPTCLYWVAGTEAIGLPLEDYKWLAEYAQAAEYTLYLLLEDAAEYYQEELERTETYEDAQAVCDDLEAYYRDAPDEYDPHMPPQYDTRRAFDNAGMVTARDRGATCSEALAVSKTALRESDELEYAIELHDDVEARGIAHPDHLDEMAEKAALVQNDPVDWGEVPLDLPSQLRDLGAEVGLWLEDVEQSVYDEIQRVTDFDLEQFERSVKDPQVTFYKRAEEYEAEHLRLRDTFEELLSGIADLARVQWTLPNEFDTNCQRACTDIPSDVVSTLDDVAAWILDVSTDISDSIVDYIEEKGEDIAEWIDENVGLPDDIGDILPDDTVRLILDLLLVVAFLLFVAAVSLGYISLEVSSGPIPIFLLLGLVVAAFAGGTPFMDQLTPQVEFGGPAPA